MRFLFVLLVSGVFFCSPLRGQRPVDSLASGLHERAGHYPGEMIYLQTSKDIYETGEDLWFKAYQLSAQNFSLSDESRCLYLQVLRQADSSVVWQEQYPIENGFSAGHVYLDKDLKDGEYLLEAYTSHSFYNDSSGLFAVRRIKVVDNIDKNPGAETPDSARGLRFDTYPEGGNLVGGVAARLAFKATDGRGNPRDVAGALYEDETPVAAFESTHDGMGVFEFMPWADRSYRIGLSSGESYALPRIAPHGMMLRLSGQTEEFVEFTVAQSPELPLRTVCLLGHMRGVPYCGARVELQGSKKVRFPLNVLNGQGIAEFTLFDEYLQPVAERLVYVHPDHKLHITATPSEPTYPLRDTVTLKIKVTDENGDPVVAHLGVSVFDKAYADPAYPVNIATHCFLSSQIRGRIHDPFYYFDPKHEDRLAALDLLLMTQGWRSYRWPYDLAPAAGGPVLGDELTGVQILKDKSLRGSEQLIQVSGAAGNAVWVWTDSTGHFSVEPEVLHQLRGGYLYLKPMLTTSRNGIKLEFEDPFARINSLRGRNERYYPFVDTSRVQHVLVEPGVLHSTFGNVLMDEIKVTARARKPFRDKFMGQLDSMAQLDLGPWVCECVNTPPHLENYRAGYTHHPAGNYTGKRLLPVIGKTYELIKYEPENKKGGYRVVDIQRIVYQGPEYSDEELLRMNNLWRTKGYYGAREFYIPDEIEMLSSLPDVRNTLLWAPSVITDARGEATLTFPCSDINTRFIGRIEGTDGNGLLGVGTCEFGVMKAEPTW